MRCNIKVLLLTILLLWCLPAWADDSVMYLDSAGTIHFVDNISQIPPQYRWQVLPPTPGPPKDVKARKKWELEKEKARRQKELEEKKRLKAEERENKRKEKEEAKLLKKAQEAEEKAKEKAEEKESKRFK
jgi:hypothetical protein